MSYLVCHMEKYHKTDICHIEEENERDENYIGSNNCIDHTRTKNNYRLLIRNSSYTDFINARISELNLSKSPRKDAVLMASFVVGSDRDFFKNLNENIFSIVNKDDVVSLVPSQYWNGFTTYGKTLTYSIKEDSERWETVFNQYYYSLSKLNLQDINRFLYGVTTSRENIYEFNESKKNVIEGYETEDLANAKINELSLLLGNEKRITDCVDMFVQEGKEGYDVVIKIRPALLIFMSEKLFSDIESVDIKSYRPFVENYISSYTSLITSIYLNTKKISLPHEIFTPFVGIENLK